MTYILAYDVGTTGIKTCLFRIDTGIQMIGYASASYDLYTLEGGGAEQHADEWWDALVSSTRELFAKDNGVSAEDVSAISFCSQMQGLVLVDETGVPVRNPMSYMDQRASEEMAAGIGSGFKIAGMNARKLLKSLRITGAVSASVKDPMWKYLWVKNNEPDNFARARWWLDVKEYFIGRMTGNFVMTRDSAFSTILYDTRNGKESWSRELCNMFGVDIEHLPPVIDVTDVAGTLRSDKAQELGLPEGIPVFGGGGDATLIGIGSGCVRTGDTHIYCGTSGWVSTIVDKQYVDTNTMMASIIGAQRGKYNYFAEMETAGKSLEWVKDHLALDEIGVYLETNEITGSKEHIYSSLYEYMSEVIERCPPGSGGVIFTPWLHGNRCPFEDHNATGIFFGLTLDTGKTEMIRAVTEGVCFHMKWMLECQEHKVHTSDTIRFCGGGALSDVTCQILADITGRRIEVPESPQNVGSAGAALTAAAGLGVIADIEAAGELMEVSKAFVPRKEYSQIYDRNYKVFKDLYNSNKHNFAAMDASGTQHRKEGDE